MRILRFFFFSFLLLLVLGALSFFAGREILLVIGANMLRADYELLTKQNYAQKCVEQFAIPQDYWTQIRFTSEKEYNLEVVCADFIASPIVVASKSLPPLLFKKSFGSGFSISEQEIPSFVELMALGRKMVVYTDANKMYSTYFFKPDLDYEAGPESSCQAHGYKCCTLDLQSGLGEQAELVNDCPKSCYQSCLLRPVILSFNARPALDETRTVEVVAGETITFSYVIGNGKDDVFANQLSRDTKTSWLESLQAFFSKSQTSQDDQIALPIELTLDFGDEQSVTSNNLQDTFDHDYTCHNAVCYFQATISVKDARGVLSVDNELAKMVVKVNR